MLQSSIGQRFNKYTPLQLAVYCMNIANRGTQNRVTILKSIKDYSMSDTLYEHETEVLQESTVDPSLFDPIFEGMVGSVPDRYRCFLLRQLPGGCGLQDRYPGNG